MEKNWIGCRSCCVAVLGVDQSNSRIIMSKRRQENQMSISSRRQMNDGSTRTTYRRRLRDYESGSSETWTESDSAAFTEASEESESTVDMDNTNMIAPNQKRS